MQVMEINFDLIFQLIIREHVQDKQEIQIKFVDVHFEVKEMYDHQLNDEKVKQLFVDLNKVDLRKNDEEYFIRRKFITWCRNTT